MPDDAKPTEAEMNAMTQVSNVTDLVPVQPRPQREVRVVVDSAPVFDTARFEHMQRIAMVMAESSMMPDSLQYVKGDDGKPVELPFKRVVANCFMIVNQAERWKFDPFAVAQCASVVHGKLMWEGKLVSAVLDANLGVRLKYVFTGEKDSTPQNRKLGVVVSGTIPGETEPRTIEGTVADWHKGDKSPWAHPGAWKRQLRYMGAREWARAHAPAIMLGVIADDEVDIEDRMFAEQMGLRRPARASAAAIAAMDIPDAGVDQTPVAAEVSQEQAPAADQLPAADDATPVDGAKVLAEITKRLTNAGTLKAIARIQQEMAEQIMGIDENSRDQIVAAVEATKKRIGGW